MPSMLLINYLIEQLRNSANYNRSVQVAPAAILWTDIDKQWQTAMPFIKQHLPELIELGDYKPEERIGPAIWVKCAIAGKLDDCNLPEDRTPIIYLPGVGRKELRAIESCPEFLKPLAELQYRGCWWAYNTAGRDWTVSSFLTNPKVGIELDLAKDKNTQQAILNVLPDLLETPDSNLRGKKLESEDFISLVLDDPTKDILGWLNDPCEKRSQWQDSRWDIFVQSCQSQFSFTPDEKSIPTALKLLCAAEGQWEAVWQRFEDTAVNLPLLVEKLKAIESDDLAIVNPENYLSENMKDEAAIESHFFNVGEKPRDTISQELMALWENDGITIAELLDRTAIDGGAMSLILKKLQDKGFLVVTKDKADKRVKRVQLTETGKKKKAIAEDVPAQMLCKLNGMTADESRTLKVLLDKLGGCFENADLNQSG